MWRKKFINNLIINVRARMSDGNPGFVADSISVWQPKFAVE